MKTIIPNDEYENFKVMIELVEKSFIEYALRENGGNIRQARIALRIPRSSMVLKMKRYGIDAGDYK